MFTSCRDVNSVIIDYLDLADIAILGALDRKWRAHMLQFGPYRIMINISRLFRACRGVAKCKMINVNGRPRMNINITWKAKLRKRKWNLSKYEYATGVAHWLYAYAIDDINGTWCTRFNNLYIEPIDFCLEMSHVKGDLECLKWFAGRRPAEHSNINPSILCAFKNGPEIFGWWHDYYENYPLRFNHANALAVACKYGQLDVLECHKRLCGNDIDSGSGVASNSDSDSGSDVSLGISKCYKPEHYLLADNNIRVLDWLYENSGMTPSQQMFERACKRGRISTLKWLIKHLGPLIFSDEIFEAASCGSNTCVLNWLKEALGYQETGATGATGYFGPLKACIGSPRWPTEICMDEMSIAGLRWWARESEEPWFTGLGDHKPTLVWTWRAIHYACATHNFAILSWWAKSGLPLEADGMTLEDAIDEGNLSILDWWADNGLPVNGKFRLRQPSMEVLAWASKHLVGQKDVYVGMEVVDIKNAMNREDFTALSWLRDSGVKIYCGMYGFIELGMDKHGPEASEWWRQTFVGYFNGQNNMCPGIPSVIGLGTLARFKWWAGVLKHVGPGKDRIGRCIAWAGLVEYLCRHSKYDILDCWVENIDHMPMVLTPRIFTKASERGDIEMLNWWLRASKCRWFSGAGLRLKHSYHAVGAASAMGHVRVLEWWKRSGLEFKYGAGALNEATKNGHMDVLNWWLHSGYNIKYEPAELCLDRVSTEIQDWWKLRGVHHS